MIVTGASQGIGKSIVFELARRGAAHVVLVSRSEAKLLAAKNEILAEVPSAQLSILPADLSNKAASVEMIHSATSLLGGSLDTLILNHITGSRFGTWLIDNKLNNNKNNNDS